MMKSMGKALNKIPDMLHMSADVDERACCAVLTHDCCCCGCLSCLILLGSGADAKSQRANVKHIKVSTNDDWAESEARALNYASASNAFHEKRPPANASRGFESGGGRGSDLRDSMQASMDMLNDRYNPTPTSVCAAPVPGPEARPASGMY